jgi:putative transposase
MIIRFHRGDSWIYKGQLLRFERELGDGLLYFLIEQTLAPLQIVDEDGIRHAPDIIWARDAYAAGHLRKASELKGPKARVLAAKREYDIEQIHDLDPKAAFRALVVRGMDKLGVGCCSDAKMHVAIAKLWAAHPIEAMGFDRKPSPRAVRKWLSERGSTFDRPLQQMVSLSGRVPRKRKLPSETCELMLRESLGYWAHFGRSIDAAYARFKGRITNLNKYRASRAQYMPQLKLPSDETFRKEIRRLECYETLAARYGEKKAKARLKASGQGLVAQRFLQLGCMDHTLVDNVVVMNLDQRLPMGRPWLTILIDVRTRCVVGWVISYEPPSLYSATECIKRASRPKLALMAHASRYWPMANIFGKFDEIVVDNGKELSGTAFEDAMIDIGTSVRWAPVASPTFKAIGERFFGTLNTLLFNRLPGATLTPKLLREMDMDPSKTAVLTIEELEDLITEAICLYHYQAHRTLTVPPAHLWEEDMEAHGIDVIPDLRRLDKMMGAMRPGCRVTRTGVIFQNLRYFDESLVGGLLDDMAGLAPQRGQPKGSASFTAKIKYNPANLGEIHVWNVRRKQYVTLPCLDHDYADGLSVTQHKMLRKWTEAKGLAFSSLDERLAALEAFSRRIEEVAPDLQIRSRRNLARMRQSPTIQGLAHDTVGLAYAPARHDGMAPILVAHDVLADTRSDSGQPNTRPARPPSRKTKAKRSTEAARRSSDLHPETGEEAFSGGYVRQVWKGFGE